MAGHDINTLPAEHSLPQDFVHPESPLTIEKDNNNSVLAISSTTELDDEGKDAAAALVAKTPISLLQELSTKRGLTPQYELLTTEGQVHEPTFVFRVLISDFVATGAGKSKKLAKHMAAKAVLEKMFTKAPDDWVIQGVEPKDSYDFLQSLMPDLLNAGVVYPIGPNSAGAQVHIPAAGPLAGANPIGILQEKCIQNKWPNPFYEIQDEEGLPHERLFVVQVRLGAGKQFCETGEGKSKKIAKRIAAEKLIARLDAIPTDTSSMCMDREALEALTVRGRGRGVAWGDGRELTELEQGLADTNLDGGGADLTVGESAVAVDKESGLNQLLRLDFSDQQPAEDHVRLVRRIGRECGWEVNFEAVRHLSTKQENQCLVTVTKPAGTPMVSFGSAKDPDSAKHKAALNILEIMKIMSSRDAGN